MGLTPLSAAFAALLNGIRLQQESHFLPHARLSLRPPAKPGPRCTAPRPANSIHTRRMSGGIPLKILPGRNWIFRFLISKPTVEGNDSFLFLLSGKDSFVSSAWAAQAGGGKCGYPVPGRMPRQGPGQEGNKLRPFGRNLFQAPEGMRGPSIQGGRTQGSGIFRSVHPRRNSRSDP